MAEIARRSAITLLRGWTVRNIGRMRRREAVGVSISREMMNHVELESLVAYLNCANKLYAWLVDSRGGLNADACTGHGRDASLVVASLEPGACEH